MTDTNDQPRVMPWHRTCRTLVEMTRSTDKVEATLARVELVRRQATGVLDRHIEQGFDSARLDEQEGWVVWPWAEAMAEVILGFGPRGGWGEEGPLASP